MCGIFGYIGNRAAFKVCIEGLKKLEYRGYDSSGIAGIENNTISLCREVGKITELEKALEKLNPSYQLGIAHTRWATHGKPSIENAHPQIDQKKTVAIVHNGVIENYAELRDSLIREHIAFSSETDTEVIAQLFALNYQSKLIDAAVKTFSTLKGSFAVALIHKDHPDEIITVAKESPLIIGYNKETQESYLSSDVNAFSQENLDLYFLEEGELAHLSKGKPPTFYDALGGLVMRVPKQQSFIINKFSKESFEHFMLKEIYEQPETIRAAIENRFDEENKTVYFKEIQFDVNELKKYNHVIVIGCGTSYHAACIATYFLESIAKISAHAEIASEFRYKNPIISENTLIIALSQSGETADTIAAVKLVKKQNTRVISLCNQPGSSIERISDSTIYLNAKPEIAVASTKTFTAQVVILYLLSILLGRQREMSNDEERLLYKMLYELPEQVFQVIAKSSKIEEVSKKYSSFNNFYFLGRGILYPIALESALKLKEIAYVNAVGYPAGEMKHGPIALLSKDLPVACFCANEALQQKMMSNLMECSARGAPIVVFSWKKFEHEIKGVVDNIIWIPYTSDFLACIPLTVATQLFAYYIARERRLEIDQPRNLAKSVTVE